MAFNLARLAPLADGIGSILSRNPDHNVRVVVPSFPVSLTFLPGKRFPYRGEELLKVSLKMKQSKE